MNALRILPMLRHSSDRHSRLSTLLAIGAFTISTAMALIVIGGMFGFQERADRESWRSQVAVDGGGAAVFGERAAMLVENSDAGGETRHFTTVVDLAMESADLSTSGKLRFTPTNDGVVPRPGEVLVSPALLKDPSMAGELNPNNPKPFSEIAAVRLDNEVLGQLDSLTVVGVISESSLNNFNERVMIIGRDATDPLVTVSDERQEDLETEWTYPLQYPRAVAGFAPNLDALETGRSRPGAEQYIFLAQFAAVLLLIPILTLGGAAARLTVARRDERLATMRLLGGTTGQVTALTAAESAIHGAIGAVTGIVVYLALMPAFAQIHFQGGPFQVADLWVGPLILLATLVVVPIIAAVSAIIGLRRVAISPLGVARRQQAPGMTILRVVIALVVLGVWAAVGGGALAMGLMAILIGLAIVFGTINLVGPWLVSLTGRIVSSLAKRPATLIAGRRLMDDPKAAWRSVSGLSLASFVAGILSVTQSLIAGADEGDGPLAAMNIAANSDIATGALLTLGIAFMVAAASAGITQAASVLDRRRDYGLLYVSGTPLAVLDGARRRATLIPLVGSAVGSAAIALFFLAPILAGMVDALDPAGLIALALCLSVGIVLVMVSSESSRPLLRNVVAHATPRE